VNNFTINEQLVRVL